MPKNLESRLRLDLLYSMKSTGVSFIIELKKWFDERVKVMEAISEIVKETSYESVPNRRFEEIAKQNLSAVDDYIIDVYEAFSEQGIGEQPCYRESFRIVEEFVKETIK